MMCDVMQGELPHMVCTKTIQNVPFFYSNIRTDFLSMIYYVLHIFTCHPIKRISFLPLELKKEMILVKCAQKKWVLPALHHTAWSHCQFEDLHTISDLNF